MIPCIKNKCLVYPSCRNETAIVCEILYKYCDHIHNQRKLKTYTKPIINNEDVVADIKKHFPKIIHVFHSNKNPLRYLIPSFSYGKNQRLIDEENSM